MKKRALALAMVLALVIGMTGTGAAFAEEAPVELYVGAMFLGIDEDKPFFPTDWVTYMEETMNINLNWTKYDNDTASLALASGDLPDLMMVNNTVMSDVLKAGVACSLDEYLDEYGPNIKKFEARNSVLRKYLSGGQDKLFFHTPNSGYEDITAGSNMWNGYLVRWDLYKELGAPAMNSDDEYINVLKQMKELYPQTENGDPVYAMGMFNDLDLWGWMMRSIANMGYSAMGNYNVAVNTVTNEMVNHLVEADITKSPYWANMTFYNKLWREGLLDPDSFSMTTEEVAEKYAKYQYLGGMCTWYTGDTWKTASAEDPNTLKGIISVPGEGMNGWYGQNAFVGWDGKYLFVTTSCPEERIPTAVKFIDFLDSEDANRVHYSGIQGKYWDYDETGAPYVFDETLALKSQGGDVWSKTGINSFGNFIGSSGFGMHSDGYYYNLFDDPEIKYASLTPMEKDFCDYYSIKYPSQLFYDLHAEGKSTNQENALHTTINMLMSDVPSNVSRITSRIQEMMIRNLPTLVQAESDEAFAAAQEQVIKDYQDAGLEEAWTWYSENWYKYKAEVEAMLVPAE